jgi:hypothetical protein
MRRSIAGISYEEVTRNGESRRLSALYFERGGLSPKSKDDAPHIAIATVCGCDIILSWNFRHIVNLRAITAVESVNIQEGYRALRIMHRIQQCFLRKGSSVMDLSRFNADDIHELRVQTAERYRNMSEEDAERDFQHKAESTRRAIEEIRRAKAGRAV